jgi:hypothetical protein
MLASGFPLNVAKQSNLVGCDPIAPCSIRAKRNSQSPSLKITRLGRSRMRALDLVCSRIARYLDVANCADVSPFLCVQNPHEAATYGSI